MIHQFIFANPRPGMSVADFQDYWIQVHAVKYAAKIPQIRKYKVSRILAAGGEVNLEVDVMARYAARMLRFPGAGEGAQPVAGGVSEAFLRENGFA